MKKLLLLAAFACLMFGCEEKTYIEVTGGKIEGVTNTAGDIRIFKGIPFAAPPVGDLRWKTPKPVEPWGGVKMCDTWGPSPMQTKPAPFMFWSSPFLIPEEPISEDCLYLNVWTGAKENQEKRPVLVYIYGGGFRSGGSACPIYDGEAMAKKGVVFVSINYRVGVFGFFAHPELTQEASYHASGNYGILDMIAALKWVKQNIAKFGGDPNNVTIAGQSAGAFGVNYLTASPLARGLFHRAIAQSGGSFFSRPGRPFATLDEAEEQGLSFAQSLNCKNLAELREKSSEEILQAQGGTSWPIVDDYLIVSSIFDVYARSRQNDVPLLLGWNKDDKLMLQPQKPDTFRVHMQNRFGDMADEFFAVYPSETDAQSAQSQFDMSRDETFGIQVYTWARMQSQTGSAKTFVYNFNRELPAHSPETAFGAFHSGEIVYAYDNLFTLDRPFEQVDHKIADIMSAYWVNFATSGDPNGSGLPKWEVFSPESEQIMLIDETSVSVPLPNKAKLLFWEKYFLANQ